MLESPQDYLMWDFGPCPRGEMAVRSHCGIKSGIDFDSLIVEVVVGCQAKMPGFAQ
jgi:hypothetical protein